MKMKKLLPMLLILTMVLAACGAPAAADPVIVEVTKIVEVEVEVPSEPEIIEVEKIVEVEVEKLVEVLVTPEPEPTGPCPDGWPAAWTEPCPEEWDVFYLLVSEHTALWEIVGENANGFPILAPYAPAITYDADDIVIAYNGNQVTEYYLMPDGTLAIDGPSRANADALYLVDGEWVAEFPGRYRGDGVMYFYKVVGPDGAGLFVRADHVTFPLCENLHLSIPESCTQ